MKSTRSLEILISCERLSRLLLKDGISIDQYEKEKEKRKDIWR
uniref:Uncharacterized protein n=1 Tax=Rhizophora mucronata TaxID=61149 RepID=A0A2P2MT43_RHIMU